MSLLEIKATFSCDECGTVFAVGLDAAYCPPTNWSLMDVAEDQVRAGLQSVQDNKHLCRKCTMKADKDYVDEHPEEA